MEKPEIAKPKAKKRHFPWLGVILGLAVAGGLVYYFVIMKNTLQVDTTPAGAKIYLDGSDSGKVSPCELEPSTGSHTIKVVLEGYADAEQQVEIKKGKNSVNINLAAATYTMTAPAAGSQCPERGAVPHQLELQRHGCRSCVAGCPTGRWAWPAVDLELYQGDTKLSDIALGVPNSGSYSWNVPATMSEGSNRRILISCPSVSDIQSLRPDLQCAGFQRGFFGQRGQFLASRRGHHLESRRRLLYVQQNGGWLGMSIYNFAYSGTSYTVESKMRCSEWIGGST